jgi:DNA-binding IclR family transcriptional regulator
MKNKKTPSRAHGPGGPVRGAQSIHRAAQLLRAIASRGRDGARLVDLTQHTRLEQPTARRILKSLIAEGIVTQEAANRRYLLGHLVFELGLAAAPQFSLQRLCEPSLLRIAEKTGDTVFLSVRSGFDTVCIDRKEGAFPIRTLTLDIGTRRPLGVGAGGIALLMGLAEADVDEILATNEQRLLRFAGIDTALLKSMIARAQELGYALNDRQVTPGAMSVGLPLANRYGPPVAAISVGAISNRMGAARQRELVAVLRQEVKVLEKLLHEATGI